VTIGPGSEKSFEFRGAGKELPIVSKRTFFGDAGEEEPIVSERSSEVAKLRTLSAYLSIKKISSHSEFPVVSFINHRMASLDGSVPVYMLAMSI